jgi:hypothetical protein
LLTTLLVIGGVCQDAMGQVVSGLQYLGQASFPAGFQFAGTTVGGLSGITYDPIANAYYVISDDRSLINPARFYTTTIDLSGNLLADGRVAFTGVTFLRTPGGATLSPGTSDTEGIAFTGAGSVMVSSEGDRIAGVQPFVNEFSLATGNEQRALTIPAKFLINPTTGVRNNLAFESLTLTPDRSTLITATENALLQDGPAAGPGVGSPSRILTYNLASGAPGAEFLYFTDQANGLVDLAALSNGSFLALERGTGPAGSLRLYQITSAGATDISGIDDISGVIGSTTPVQKTLLLDFLAGGLPINNFEGLTFGAPLDDGRMSLILVSDNNFGALGPIPTQFIAFGVQVVPEPGVYGLAVGALFGGACLRRRIRRGR